MLTIGTKDTGRPAPKEVKSLKNSALMKICHFYFFVHLFCDEERFKC